MKSILTIIAFTTVVILTGCGNDNTSKEDNEMDSIGNPSSDPSSTSVLTDDSIQLKNTDTMSLDSLHK